MSLNFLKGKIYFQEWSKFIKPELTFLKHFDFDLRYDGAVGRKLKILDIIRSLDLPNNPLDDIIDQVFSNFSSCMHLEKTKIIICAPCIYNNFTLFFGNQLCNAFCSLEVLTKLQRLQGGEACLLGRLVERVFPIRHETRKSLILTLQNSSSLSYGNLPTFHVIGKM